MTFNIRFYFPHKMYMDISNLPGIEIKMGINEKGGFRFEWFPWSLLPVVPRARSALSLADKKFFDGRTHE
jgi:hypothetical protein